MDRVLTPALRAAAAAVAAAAAALLLAAAPAPAHAADGAALFATHCAECHSLKEGKDKKGPSLFASFGRPAGGRTGFVYSDALKAAGLVWTPEALEAYIAAPGKKLPGGKMKFDGLPDAAERAALLAYLAQAAK